MLGVRIVDESTRRRYLATMQTHIGALSAMIDDLFELSRIEAGEIEWSMQQVELAVLVDETVAAMRPEARARRVDVRSELDDPLLAARADPEKIQRVLFNLIRNAIRHTPADGSVTVRAEARPEAVQIEVADTGDGILDEDRGARVRTLLPWRPRGRTRLGGRRPRPGHLPRHRRDPRRAHLDRPVRTGHARPLQPAEHVRVS